MKKFNGVLQYAAIFFVVFVIAALVFFFVLSALFPANTLNFGSVSPYYDVNKKTSPKRPDSSSNDSSEAESKYELSDILSIYNKLSVDEKLSLYTTLSNKFTNDELNELYAMSKDGMTDEEKSYLNSLATQRLTAEEINKLFALYEKYSGKE